MHDVVPAEAGDFEINLRDPQVLATLISTSGTTGRPKGVMLSHLALLWNAEAAGKVITPRADDVFLSHLPLAHAFERTVGYYLAMMGGSVVAYARSIDLLKDDIAAIRPTVFLSVQHPISGWPPAFEDKLRTIGFRDGCSIRRPVSVGADVPVYEDWQLP